MKSNFVKIALDKIQLEKPYKKVVIASVKCSQPSVNLITENGHYVSLTPEAAIQISKHMVECAYLANPKLSKIKYEGEQNHGISLN